MTTNKKIKPPTDRRYKDDEEKVVPFTFYLLPDKDAEVRQFAKDKDWTLTKLGNRAFDLIMKIEGVAS